MDLPDILAGLTRAETGLAGAIPEDWLQGRTAYGGLSAAIALHAARAAHPHLPPLRSAQISFIGPLAGAIEVRAELIRRGRTAGFVNCDVVSEQGLGLRAMFVFMDERESAIDHVAPDFPPVPPPDEAKAVARTDVIAFLRNFDFVDLKAIPGQGPADCLRWIRLRERAGLDPEIELLTVADALPPAAMRLIPGFGPISSMTWIANLLTPRPATDDGWWLLRSRSDHARRGTSSQVMSVWNARGEQVLTGMQSVAIFV
ncbi:MAG: thioesterase family protein [Sphingomonadaceae bacterium]|nr:thioesterase family protein [Sphingomonadaceae bacterium]